MCGIVGYISLSDGVYVEEKRHFMRYALMLDTLRGMDSTGLIKVNGDFTVRTQHTVLAGDEYVHTKGYRDGDYDAWCKVGHNRAATKGSVKLDNAHPFTFGDVTLVHNGTLYQAGASIDTFDHKLEVDSMQIALALSKAEPGDAKKVLEGIDGSFAVVWADKRDGSVNMARNMDRPLHFCYNQSRDIMWFMSDGLHLKSIMKSLYRRTASGTTIYQMDKHKVLKFTKGNLVPEVTSFVPFVRPTTPTKTKYPAVNPRKPSGIVSALTRAARKWVTPSEASRTPGGSTAQRPASGPGLRAVDMRVEVNGKSRRLLTKHLTELQREYDLKPTQQVEFSPTVKYKQRNGRYAVIGDITHPEWDGAWDAVIYDVKKVIVNAYMSKAWTVNPVGVSRPHELTRDSGTFTVPSILCSLVDCKWEEDEIATQSDDDSPILVPVGDRTIEAGRLDKMMEKGCVQCGSALELEDMNATIVVNDGQDLLCAACQMELNPASNEHQALIN